MIESILKFKCNGATVCKKKKNQVLIKKFTRSVTRKLARNVGRKNLTTSLNTMSKLPMREHPSDVELRLHYAAGYGVCLYAAIEGEK
jgi:hypothetical protein